MLEKSEDHQCHYVVFARRLRPQKLSELIGQDVVQSSLGQMIQTQKIPHALLFSGTRGCGKTSTARIFAKSLCCENGPTVNPCQTCSHCRKITDSCHEDVLEIDGASHTGVDNIREINEKVFYYPNSARFKIVIIDEVHMLSQGAFNAILKTLEEPPERVVFILATTELHKVPITVKSRTLSYTFHKIETAVIKNYLCTVLDAEKIHFDENAVALISREAGGSLRDALSLLDQTLSFHATETLTFECVHLALGLRVDSFAMGIFQSICQEKLEEGLDLLRQAENHALNMTQTFQRCASYFRVLLIYKDLKDKEKIYRLCDLLPSEFETLLQYGGECKTHVLSEIYKTIYFYLRDFYRTHSQISLAEIILMDCISKVQWLSATELLSAIKQGSLEAPQQKNCEISVSKTSTEPEKEVSSENSLPEENQNIDMALYRQFIDIARAKSKTLGLKMKAAKVTKFLQQGVSFVSAKENEIYFNLSADDVTHFWECFEQLKIPKKAVSVPFLQGGRVSQSLKNPDFDNAKPTSKKIDTTEENKNVPSVSEKLEKLLEKDPFSHKGTSMEEIAHRQVDTDFQNRVQQVKNNEGVQKIMKMASKTDFVNLEGL